MDNYPFSLAWPRPTSMSFTIRKEWLQIAALPAARGEAVLAKVQAAFPQAVAAPTTLHTGLNNANGILHVANMVCNIGRLEATGNRYRFYAEGIRRAPSSCWRASGRAPRHRAGARRAPAGDS